jgi:hypothetical protein
MARHEELSVGILTVNEMYDNYGRNLMPGANPYGGEDYIVDDNVSASGLGKSWGLNEKRPLKTFVEAVSASNISIASTSNRWWNRRNRIFVSGGPFTEDLTQLPTKCEVIGVGSYDAFTQGAIIGHHSNALEAYGTIWNNMHFKAKAVASPIFTLAGATGASGQQFKKCTFDATAGTVTSAILSTAMPFLQVENCRMMGAFATSYISFGAGEAGGARIVGNEMTGSLGKGIVLPDTTTASWAMKLLDNPIIQSAGKWVEDAASILYVINNRAITAIDCATYTAGFTMNLLRAAGNIQTGGNAGDCDTVPHLLFA